MSWIISKISNIPSPFISAISSYSSDRTKFTTKTTTYPKIQEIRTYDILTCIVKLKNFHNTFLLNFFKTKSYLTNCRKENITSPFQEIFKRFISPFYLPVLSLIACLAIIKSKDDYKYITKKFETLNRNYAK